MFFRDFFSVELFDLSLLKSKTPLAFFESSFDHLCLLERKCLGRSIITSLQPGIGQVTFCLQLILD